MTHHERPQRQPTIPGSRRAFTLLEILAVITLVLLLAGLLFPVIRKMSEAAKRAGCVSNLRQLGVGAALYAADAGNGEWPYYEALNIPGNDRGGWSSPIIWYNDYKSLAGIGKVYPYVKDKKVFICPKNLPFQQRQSYFKIPDWSNASQNVWGSYVVRGYGQTYNSTGTPPNRVGKKMFEVSRRAIASCFFMQQPNNPNQPLSWHDLSWPVLFGDGSIQVIQGLPPDVEDSSSTDVWGVTSKQWKFWDHFDAHR